MFKSRSKSKEAATAPVTTATNGGSTSPGGGNVVAAGTFIEGKMTTTEDMRLDGQIKGEINCQKKFVIGEQGNIEGDVDCSEASVKGKIHGTIKVNGLLHLMETAKLEGKILAKKMVVDEGASYSGECLIGEQHVK